MLPAAVATQPQLWVVELAYRESFELDFFLFLTEVTLEPSSVKEVNLIPSSFKEISAYRDKDESVIYEVVYFMRGKLLYKEIPFLYLKRVTSFSLL